MNKNKKVIIILVSSIIVILSTTTIIICKSLNLSKNKKIDNEPIIKDEENVVNKTENDIDEEIIEDNSDIESDEEIIDEEETENTNDEEVSNKEQTEKPNPSPSKTEVKENPVSSNNQNKAQETKKEEVVKEETKPTPPAETTTNNSNFQNKLNSVINSQIRSNMSNIEKIKKIHDWMVENISYDLSGANYTKEDALLKGSTVCQGYADLFQAFMDNLGITTKTITGTTSAGPHAWNAVMMNGQWFYIDVTWDDPIMLGGSSNNLDYTYFMVPYSVISRDHSTSTVLSNNGTSMEYNDWVYGHSAEQDLEEGIKLLDSMGVTYGVVRSNDELEQVLNEKANLKLEEFYIMTKATIMPHSIRVFSEAPYAYTYAPYMHTTTCNIYKFSNVVSQYKQKYENEKGISVYIVNNYDEMKNILLEITEEKTIGFVYSGLLDNSAISHELTFNLEHPSGFKISSPVYTQSNDTGIVYREVSLINQN